MREQTHLSFGQAYAGTQVRVSLKKRDWSAVTWKRSRSAIVRNPKGPDGWRKPSPYYACITHNDPGTVRVTGYSGEGIYRRDFEWYGTIFVNVPGGAAVCHSVDKKTLEANLPTQFAAEKALVKALNNVADRKASFSESVAELRSSVVGLARNATQINEFLSAALKRDWFRAGTALGLNPRSRKARRARDRTIAAGQGLSSAWLNYWFGLSPIVSDMVAIAAYMSDESVHNKLRVKGSATVPIYRKTSVETIEPSFGYGMPGIKSSSNVTINSYGKVSLTYTIPDTDLRRLTTFGAVDIPATAWAILPWSFAIDWVIPVSEILKSLTASHGLNFRGGTMTKVVKISKDPINTVVVPAISSQVIETNVAIIGKVSGLLMERSVYKSDPKPVSLWVKDPFDVWKGVTSLALLTNLLFKSK